MRDGLAAKLLQILSFREQAVNQGERALGGTVLDSADQFVQDLRRYDARAILALALR